MLALATRSRNAWPVGRSASSNAPSGPRHLRTDRISVTGVVVALVGAAIATVVGRATGAGWLPAIGLAVLLGVGLYLWARDKDKGWGDLGEGIMVSVTVAIALMAVQRDADDRTREATERRERQIREADAAREEAAERQNLQLSLTMQADLRGIALADRDLHGFFLAGKDLTGADLHGANLVGADLHGSQLRRANLLGANLDNARMADADLRGAVLSPASVEAERLERAGQPATLREAQLQKADLRGTGLDGVDFRGAHLTSADLRRSVGGDRGANFQNAILILADFRGADMTQGDLRGALLDWAQFCGASGLRTMDLRRARYSVTTHWPQGYDPKKFGAQLSGDASRIGALTGLRTYPLQVLRTYPHVNFSSDDLSTMFDFGTSLLSGPNALGRVLPCGSQ
jgi:uncharacterized protein YjbI with pentapeptide repeats